MNIEDQGVSAQPKKPAGPLTRAAIAGAGIMAGFPATDPDTDGRRNYSPGYGESFAYRGGSSSPSGPGNGPDSTALTPAAQGIAAPSTRAQPAVAPTATDPGTRPGGTISSMLQAAPQGAPGVGNAEVRQSSGEHGASTNQGIAAPPAWRNDQGVITADSAKGILEAPMQRSGGIFGTADMKGVNEIMARENAVRQSIIDKQPQGGVGILGDGGISAANDEKTQRWALEGIAGQMKSAGTRTERAALGQALSQTIAGQSQQASDAMHQQGIMAGLEVKSRAQDVGVQRAQDRNEVTARGQDIRAETSANRIASNEAIAGARIAERSNQAGRLTLPQRRSNFEIDAARKAVAGLSADEIKRKTANFTSTGRENPEFDPSLAKAVSLANRRKYGADDHFDQREQSQQQAQQPAGNDGDVNTRFRADQEMQGHKLGKQTDQGTEVFDTSGRLIGHYR